MTKFIFEDKSYLFDSAVCEKIDEIIQLPDGRFLMVVAWSESAPPRPKDIIVLPRLPEDCVATLAIEE